MPLIVSARERKGLYLPQSYLLRQQRGVLRAQSAHRVSAKWEDLWLHEEDNCEHNATLISDALLSGNAHIRLRTNRVGLLAHIGGTISTTGASGAWLDCNHLDLFWFRAANQAYTAASPGPNGEVEWDPTGGEGSTPASLRDHISFTNCTDVKVLNAVVRGLNTTGAPDSVLEKEAGITLRNVSGFELHNNHARFVWGDGLMLRAVSAHLPRVTENGLIREFTAETIGRMQAAFTNFFHVTVDGIYTHPDTISTQGSGISNRSALDIEMTTRADVGGVLAESGWIDIYNWELAANFFILANAGAGYVHDITLRDGLILPAHVGNLATFKGRDDDGFAKRAKIAVRDIDWAEVGGANNVANFEYVRDWLRVSSVSAHESNLGAGKNGFGLTECEGVDLQNNSFTGGFSTLYTDKTTDTGQTARTEATVDPIDGGASSWSDGSWGTAVAEAWTSPANAKTDNGSRATANLAAGEKTNDLRVSNFGISLPTGATIVGIEIRVQGRCDSANTLRCQLVKGGTLHGSTKNSSLSTDASDANTTFGGEADLWGGTWTKSDVEASNFGVYVGLLEGGSAQVDVVDVRVHYTWPVGPSVISVCSGNTPACP